MQVFEHFHTIYNGIPSKLKAEQFRVCLYYIQLYNYITNEVFIIKLFKFSMLMLSMTHLSKPRVCMNPIKM